MTIPDKIHFHYLVSPFYFPDRREFKTFLLRLCKQEGFAVEEINYIFCTDEYLLDINQRFLNHDTFTDIITFEYSSGSEPLQSDIYISVERVRENATTYGTSFRRELSRVIIHGALHLCGFKDKSKKDARVMREMEDRYLRQMFHVK